MGRNFFLNKSDLRELLAALSRIYDVYTPVKKGQQRFFKKYSGEPDTVVLGEVRTFEPLKAFFTRARESVAKNFGPEVPHEKDKGIAIVGVKACDLKGFKIQDFVFRDQGAKDPFYAANRERNFIVSSDCTCAIETCFCVALGIRPYPREDFDLNLSAVENGFVAETGSEKGRIFAEKNPSLFRESNERQLHARDVERERMVQAVEENLRKYDIPREESFQGVIKRNYESEIWNDEAKTCVECGACTVICPTCHCFLLYDQKSEAQLTRLRVWDSCMIKDYARVAGGANPRKKLWMRLRNRFDKKFDFFPEVAHIYACTGCGRCVSACPGKIDIRKVLKRLVAHA